MSESTGFKKGRCIQRWNTFLLATVLIAGCTTLAAHNEGPLREGEEVAPFVAEMRGAGLDESEVRKILADARIVPEVLEAISRPAEAKPWYAYRPIFVTESRIAKGVEFWRSEQATLERAEKAFGVPAEIIVAIIGVETLYGERAGRIRVLDSLVTLGFRYPRRSKFFRSELKHFLLLARDERLDPLAVKGSYAGAMGVPQFISSSYRNYAVDFDDDGRRDLISSTADAIGSVANYLKRHGWLPGGDIAVAATVDGAAYKEVLALGLKPELTVKELSEKGIQLQGEVDRNARAALIELEQEHGMEYWVALNNFYVITRYNHSQLYAMAVTQLAAKIRDRYL
ncbi:MAG: lytic murein transglycosylase B [Gammaproteobacteria bacterium]|nr:lytic murein transglycosylase B [Gammaproteobacteria bacterium]